MQREARHPCVVVGFDGSPSSLAAVCEAAKRAGSDGWLIVVHAYGLPPAALGWPLYHNAVQDAEIGARRFLDQLRGHPALEGVHWTAEIVAGRSADVIDAAARNNDADAIYIGSRGVGRASALLGSVAHDLLHRADRPVTVITERAAERSLTAAA